MIRFVKGTLAFVGEGEVIIENNGIGYGISVPMSVIEQLPEIGGEVMLYTYMNVVEDAMQLFGFLVQEDLRMYKLLDYGKWHWAKGGAWDYGFHEFL